ncbi:MAG: chalcone isomerase family protein [Pseudobdellovibrio sp.]
MKKMLFAFVMAASVFAQAAPLLTYTPGNQNLNGVVLNQTAAINDANGAPTALKMDLLGAGVRSKTVLIVQAKVYTLQLFSDNKAAFSRDAAALSSLVSSSTRVALRIDMLRTISADQLQGSMQEALQANNYQIDAELQNVLNLFGKSAEPSQGKSISVLLVKDVKNNKTNLYYQDTAGTTQSVVGSPELMTKILSIWLGNPVDDGIANLKASLLKPVY